MARWKSRLKKVAIVLVILVLILSIVWVSVSLYYREKIKGEIARIEAAGDSLGIEWMSGERIPPEQNGARFYREAAAATGDPRSFYTEKAPQAAALKAFGGYLGGKKPWPSGSESALRKLLAENAMVFELLRKADSFEKVNFEVQWFNSNFQDTHFSDMRFMSTLLALDAIMNLRDGKCDEAIPVVRMMLRLRRGSDAEPLAISKMNAYALDRTAFCVLREFRGKTFRNIDGLHGLMGILSGREWDNRVALAMKGERSFGINRFFRVVDPSNRVPWLTIDKYYYLLTMDRYIKLLEKDIRPAAQRGSLEVELDNPSSSFYIPRFCLVANGTLRGYSKMRIAEAVMDAKADLARTALALEVCRIEKRGYPDALAALVPDVLEKVPDDLFSGKALIYKSGSGDYLLYSVGPNRTDEGGTQAKDAYYCQDGDLVWAAPAHQAASSPVSQQPAGKIKSPGAK